MTEKLAAVELTPELLKQIEANLKERFAEIAERYPALVMACPYEMKLAVTSWVMQNIVAHATEGGSFRYLVYDRLGFGTDAYVPLHQAGGMTISNEFTITRASPEDAELSKRLLTNLLPYFEGGKEPWLTICAAASRIEALSEALATEQEKRRRIEAELPSGQS